MRFWNCPSFRVMSLPLALRATRLSGRNYTEERKRHAFSPSTAAVRVRFLFASALDRTNLDATYREYTEPTPSIEMGCRLRRRPRERNQRPLESRTEAVRHLVAHIIARYDGKSENK